MRLLRVEHFSRKYAALRDLLLGASCIVRPKGHSSQGLGGNRHVSSWSTLLKTVSQWSLLPARGYSAASLSV